MKNRLVLLLVVFTFACNLNRDSSQGSNSASVTTPSPSPTTSTNLALADVWSAIEKAGLPVKEPVIYDENTDTNKLLKRPNQYIEKMNFTDQRIKSDRGKHPDFDKAVDSAGGKDWHLKCSIEVFNNADDAMRRKNYIDEIGKHLAPMVEYSVVHKNVLLRIDKELTPAQYEEYKKVIESL